MKLRTLSFFFLAGCSGAATDARPPLGVYSADYELLSNDCSPLPTPLLGTFGANVTATQVIAPMPNGPNELESIPFTGDSIDDLSQPCGATRDALLELESLDATQIVVKRTTTFSNIPASPQSLCSLPVAACTSVERFRYTLVQACAAPCTFTGNPGTTACSCP